MVGGVVCDHLLGIPSKDVDLEVYGLNYEQIVAALSCDHASANLVGRSFGVVKVGQMLDVSMPRRESKSGMGHKGFAIDVGAGAVSGRRRFIVVPRIARMAKPTHR